MRKETIIKVGALVLLILLFLGALNALIAEMSRPVPVVMIDYEKLAQPGTEPGEE